MEIHTTFSDRKVKKILKDFNSPPNRFNRFQLIFRDFMSRDKLILKTRTKVQEQLRLKSWYQDFWWSYSINNCDSAASTEMDKWHRKVSQEQTHAYRSYTHKEVVQQMTGEQRVWSFSRYEDNCSLVGGGGVKVPHHCLTPYTKFNPKWSMNLNLKGILKLKKQTNKQNNPECLYKPGARRNFQLDYIKNKNLCSPEHTIKSERPWTGKIYLQCI